MNKEEVLNKFKDKAPIVREFWNYIILAQDERDYQGKCQKIEIGDRRGFYNLNDFK